MSSASSPPRTNNDPRAEAARSIAPATPDALTRLRAHLRYCYATIPFYRDRFDRADLDVNRIESFDVLHRLPMLTKEEIIAQQAAHPPFGWSGPGGDLARINVIASTYYMCFSHADLVNQTRQYAEAFSTLGVVGSDLVDLASAFHWVIAGTQMDEAIRSLGATVIPAGPGHSEQRLRVLRDTGVTVLQAFTPYADELTTRFAEAGIDPEHDLRVRLLLIGGELRDSAAKRRLEAAWGGAVSREFYGASEAGMVAAECHEAGEGMHVGNHALVEVVDPESGEPVPPGAPGEVVTTELWRRAQPFIRYRTGDITEGLQIERCECGRAAPRLGRIIGRNGEIPRIKGLFIAPGRIRLVVERHAEIVDWRMRIDRPGTTDRLTVEIACSDPDDRGDLQPALADQLKDAVGIKCDVALFDPSDFGPTDGRVVDERQFS